MLRVIGTSGRFCVADAVVCIYCTGFVCEGNTCIMCMYLACCGVLVRSATRETAGSVQWSYA